METIINLVYALANKLIHLFVLHSQVAFARLLHCPLHELGNLALAGSSSATRYLDASQVRNCPPFCRFGFTL
jgi:hypothetical protein